MESSQTCFIFPCSFPLKVMGLNTEAFTLAVKTIFERHLPGAEISYSSQPSKNGKYLSITATFTATSKEQLDALYRELNAHELVVMTL